MSHYTAALSKLLGGVAAALGAAVLLAPPVGAAPVLYDDIGDPTAEGIASILVGDDQSCQVGELGTSYIQPGSGALGDCGVFLKNRDWSTLYTADFAGHQSTGFDAPYTPLTFVGKDGPHVSGTTRSTEVTATAGDLTITENVSFVVGEDRITITLRVANSDPETFADVQVGYMMDCAPGDVDGQGYGFLVPGGEAGCIGVPRLEDANAVYSLSPLAPTGSDYHAMVGRPTDVWHALGALDDTVKVDDNGGRYDPAVAIGWDAMVPPGGDATALEFTLSQRIDLRPKPPTNIVAPQLTRSGDTLTSTNGTWSSTAGSYEVSWMRCVSGDCHDIAGATGSTYELTAADAGTSIMSLVKAFNDDTGRSTARPSAPLAIDVIGGGTAPADPPVVTPPATTPVDETTPGDSAPADPVSSPVGPFGTPAPSTAAPSDHAKAPAEQRRPKCVSQRTVRMRWKVRRQHDPVRTLSITINGRRRVLRRGARSAVVDMRGRSKGTVRATVRATLRSGRTVKTTRVYHPCSTERDSRPKTLFLR